MSNAIIEAMCVGLPVVTTAVSGTKELIDEGRGGFITEIGNEEMFSTTMERVLSDESAMRKMGEYNKSKAYLFKQDTIVDEWECLISTIIN
jgi:glycosyltransferase involved in cell wall biosynthesis